MLMVKTEVTLFISKDGKTADNVVLEPNRKYFCKQGTVQNISKKVDFEGHYNLYNDFSFFFCKVVQWFAIDLTI